MSPSERMSALEVRASASLASIYGLRMLGMFLILPIFAIYAETLPNHPSHLMIGLALGAYGLTQAIFQLPFGMASDKYGRKRVIYFGLAIFAIGSLVAAMAHNKAMVMIGGTIGITFALSLILGPALNQWIGVPGIFAMTGMLTLLAMLVVRFVVPDPLVSRFHSDAEAATGKLKEVLADAQLLRLNFGIFALHAAQMAMFVVVPFAIKQSSGMNENDHWQIYLPVLVLSFVLMVPAIIYGEKRAKLKQVFVGAVAIMLAAQLLFAFSINQFWGIVASLSAYFIAFNVLEASLPSIITKLAPAASKGTAIGVYNTSQSLGVFVGGALGGYLSHYHGYASVFVFCSVMMALWLLFAISMKAPPAVKSKMYHLDEMSATQGQQLSAKLALLEGVREAVVLPDEGTVILKVDMQQGFDEAQVLALIELK